MKKTLLSVLSLLTIGAISQVSNVENRDFESWTQIDYSIPDTLTSTVEEYLKQGAVIDVAPVEKSNDAFKGSHSIKLSSVETSDNDTVNGYTILGNWGDDGPEGGYPYTFQGDSFTFHYKCDLQPNDTAWAIITLKKAGSTIGGGFYPITGTHNTWTEYTAVNPGALLVPDTFFFAAIATNAINDESLARPGSWVQLDEVGMKKTNGDFKAIANGGFESWTDTTIHILDDWYTVSATKSSTAKADSYSVELQTRERTDGDGDLDTTIGWLTNVNYASDNEEGTPYVMEPQALSIWVDFEPNGMDTAMVSIQFLKNGSWVAGNNFEIESGTTGFEEVVIPLSFSEAPDTFKLYVSSGEVPGSIIRIDEADLTDSPTSSSEVTMNKFNVYPNPAEGLITLSSKGDSYKVFDVLGSVITSNNIVSTKTQIELNEYNSGVYFISVFDASNNLIGTQQFVVK